ncbi:efflux RND transporter periplasmic adaptor subunit [Flavisphingomonas formosensis]|uniref:efflux RND transporter periplasmic adaptor subunit n=1 Tax=Flavisphingomonas formosensis TaxID=861534 RepID=UPI0012FA6255|nr:efflux RND transporter periplasmic adaptor subunit [Sphingomonas formosensis]
MLNTEPAGDLPPARTLGKTEQIRLLAIGAAVLVAIVVIASLVHLLLKPAEVTPPALPPGSFRPTQEQLGELKIQTVRIGSNAGMVDATGVISVDEDHSTPVVLPYSGQVTDVFVQAGQRVTRGQPLLKIASSDFVDARNTLFSAAAQRATAAAQLKMAEDNAKRQQAIFQTAGGALKDYRQAESDLIAARSTMRSADAALGASRDKLALLGKTPDEVKRLEAAGEVAGIYARTTYHAPVNGTIATRDVAPGQYVTAGGDKPVMTITDLSTVWLIAQISESDIPNVRLGDGVDVTTPAYPGRVFHAVIDNIGAGLDPATHRLPVRATVTNPGEALKPQMFASFAIRRPASGSAVLVPASAVIHEGDTARVWVLGRDGLLYARPVTVTDSASGYETISAGLKPGERIVTAGALFVNEAGIGE